MYGVLNLVPEGKQVGELDSAVCFGPPFQQFIIFPMRGKAEVEIIIE